jgi:membrane associated rhomboid family serine protease
MPQCLKCGAELQVNEEGVAPVLCDRCAGVATSRARRSLSTGTLRDYPATTILTAINVAVFAGMVLTGAGIMDFTGPALREWGANIGPLTLSGEYWRLITAGFVHSGLLHIGFNMWCLWSLGQLSEKLFGSWITLAVYLLTGVGGAMLSVYHNPGTFEVGASGAIFGIAGATLSGVKFGNVSLSAGQKKSILSSLIFFVGFNLFIGATLPRIDNWCHLGGLITGLIFGAPLATANASGKKTFEWMTILLAAAVMAGLGWRLIGVEGEPVRLQQEAIQDLRQENYPAAITLLEKMTAADPNNARSQAMLGYAYWRTGQNDKAIDAYKVAAELNPEDTDVQQALQQLEAMKALQENSPTKKQQK